MILMNQPVTPSDRIGFRPELQPAADICVSADRQASEMMNSGGSAGFGNRSQVSPRSAPTPVYGPEAHLSGSGAWARAAHGGVGVRVGVAVSGARTGCR